MTAGLIFGRFMPPHAGHRLLADTAARLVDDLTILLCWSDADPIAGPLRAAWLAEMFPTARIVAHPVSGDAPFEDDDPACWRAAIVAAQIGPMQCVFAADDRGRTLAGEIGARFHLIDPAHATIPVSSAMIRAEPMTHWRWLPAAVRPHYAKTVCLHGPESTGKSTLAPQLAAHYRTIYLPEYGRTYCENFGLALAMRDLVEIGKTHVAMTQAALRQCNRRLILDTDPLMTAAWADMLFERRDPWFDAFDATADLYLLLDIDMPWVDDGTRFFGDDGRRRRFFDLSRAELERRGLPYAVIGGPPEERFDRAIAAIDAAGLG